MYCLGTLELDADAPMDLEVELSEPYKIFQELSRKELEELVAEIKEQVALKSDPEYWGALLVTGEDELLKPTDEQKARGVNR